MSDKEEQLVRMITLAIRESHEELKEAIQAVRAELKAEIQAVRAELKEEIQAVRTELKAEIQAVRAELKAEIQAIRTYVDERFEQTANSIRYLKEKILQHDQDIFLIKEQLKTLSQ